MGLEAGSTEVGGDNPGNFSSCPRCAPRPCRAAVPKHGTAWCGHSARGLVFHYGQVTSGSRKRSSAPPRGLDIAPCVGGPDVPRRVSERAGSYLCSLLDVVLICAAGHSFVPIWDEWDMCAAGSLSEDVDLPGQLHCRVNNVRDSPRCARRAQRASGSAQLGHGPSVPTTRRSESGQASSARYTRPRAVCRCTVRLGPLLMRLACAL